MATIRPVEFEFVLDSRDAGLVVRVAFVVVAGCPCVSSLKELPLPSDESAAAGPATGPSASNAAQRAAASAPREALWGSDLPGITSARIPSPGACSSCLRRHAGAAPRAPA